MYPSAYVVCFEMRLFNEETTTIDAYPVCNAMVTSTSRLNHYHEINILCDIGTNSPKNVGMSLHYDKGPCAASDTGSDAG